MVSPLDIAIPNKSRQYLQRTHVLQHGESMNSVVIFAVRPGISATVLS